MKVWCRKSPSRILWKQVTRVPRRPTWCRSHQRWFCCGRVWWNWLRSSSSWITIKTLPANWNWSKKSTSPKSSYREQKFNLWAMRYLNMDWNQIQISSLPSTTCPSQHLSLKILTLLGFVNYLFKIPTKAFGCVSTTDRAHNWPTQVHRGKVTW